MANNGFPPEPSFDSRTFRNTLGLFATGVTVVAVEHRGHLHAMTVNSITSLSLDPPLLIFCVAKTTRMVNELREAAQFTVSILTEQQEALSNYFAGRAMEETPEFRFGPWEGGPRLEGCLAAVGCEVADWLEGGDHWIVVGRAVALYRSPVHARPLLFYSGSYRHLDSGATPAPDLEEDTPPVQIFYDPW